MPSSPSSGRRTSRPLRILVLAAVALQRDLAVALDLTAERRTATVVAMLASNARRAPGYWIQLTLAMGIATLGLVLGSTAVVIGAMLVSPLMGPIIELGMGFAVGSSLLVIRSFLRIMLSVAWVVLSAALITLLLPFHEVTTEIAARTAPTALDLLVAAFCALTAAYTTARAAADTTAAAAGTAIGIALVPPLCVAGYGVGTGSVDIASGAGLLFTANFSAIVVLAALSFVLLGYHEVEAGTLERDVLQADSSRTERLAERAHLRLSGLFGSRYGRVMRLLVPALFLLAVYAPLSRALDEVAWQVRVRNSVERLLAPERGRVVQTSLTAERHTVSLRLVMLGTPEVAATLERRLATRVAALSGVEPMVTVVAVPDAAALSAISARERRASAPGAAPAQPDLDLLRQRVAATLGTEWPTTAVGPVVGWTLELASDGQPRLLVRHIGPPLGAGGESLLAARLGAAVGDGMDVSALALPPDTVVAVSQAESAWVTRAVALSATVAAAPRAAACVTVPPVGTRRRARETHDVILRALKGSPAARVGRLTMTAGPTWAAWPVDASSAHGCAASGPGEPPGSDAR